jgi:hypothetical protein
MLKDPCRRLRRQNPFVGIYTVGRENFKSEIQEREKNSAGTTKNVKNIRGKKHGFFDSHLLITFLHEESTIHQKQLS